MSLRPDLLNGVRGVPGTIAACLFDSSRRVLAHALQPPYEPVLLVSVMERVDALVAIQRGADVFAQPKVLIARFSEGVVVTRWFEGYTLFVLAAPTVNVAMVTVASNALQANLAAVGGLAALAVESPGVAMAAVRTSPTAPPARVAAPSTTGPAALSTSFLGPAAAGDGNFVSIELLRTISTMLARHVGPLAQAVTKRDIDRMGFTPRTLPQAQLEPLLQRLSATITDPVGRAEFLSAAKALVG